MAGMSPPSPLPSLASAVPAKMRSRAALYLAERSANVSEVFAEAGESLLAYFPVCAAERFRMRMGDWNAEAGGMTLEPVPVLGDVVTS